MTKGGHVSMPYVQREEPYMHCFDNAEFQKMFRDTDALLKDIRGKSPSSFNNGTTYLSRYNNCVKEFNDVYKKLVVDFEGENKKKMELPKLDRAQTVAKSLGANFLTPNANDAIAQANDLKTKLQKRKNCFFAEVVGGDNSPAKNLNLVRSILKLNFENIVNDEKQASISDIPFLEMIDVTSENAEVPKGGRKRKTRQQTNRRRRRRQRKSRRHHRK